MLQVTFEYPMRNQSVQVVATCKNIIGAEYIEGLTLTFLNEDDIRIFVPYEKDLFEDIESEAVYMLAEAYYNPELNFAQGAH